MGVAENFENFYKELHLSDTDETNKTQRFHSITKRLKIDFYSSYSDTNHSFYAGSHGRGTDIYTSDIDMVFVLPYEIYAKYNAYDSNGQSALLQAVKNSIKNTYPNTDVGGDGQVVVVNFSDGMKFEVVPAFINKDGHSYTYPDSNDGGSWRVMDPKKEIDEFNDMDRKCNGNLKRLCRMIREWNKTNNVLLSGILIDVMCYRFLSNYTYKDKSFLYYDYFTRDFMEYLIDHHEQEYWIVPGSDWHVYKKYTFKREATEAYNNSLEAIDDEKKEYYFSAKKNWRKIYGSKFPV